VARAVAQAAQEERAKLEARFYAALARARPDIKSAALKRIAREVARRYRALGENGIDVAVVLGEIADNLDASLAVEENVGLALSVLDRYARTEPAAAPPDTQVEEARRRCLDLLWKKKEFGKLSEDEEEELKALIEFLEKIGKLPSEALATEENWHEILRFAATPTPVKVELVEIECEVWLPEPGSVRLNGEELYRVLVEKGRELVARGLL
jgi:hypothetical protein